MTLDLSQLAVCTMISNPVRYKSRVRLYHEFKRHITHDLQMPLWTVEVAHGARSHEVTDEGDPHALQLRTGPRGELWQKERALNLLFARLPAHVKYIAWVDADITFARRDVFTEAMHVLQHSPVCQLWSHANDLGPRGRIIKQAKSFAACYLDNNCEHPTKGDPYSYAHSGYAWAARREFFDVVGGLYDMAPLGSSDFYMAWAIVQQLSPHLSWRLKTGFTRSYVETILQWQERAKGLHRDVGVVEGTILHHWHGKKAARQYASREDILVRNKFDPLTDLKPDIQGLWQFTMREPRLMFDVRAYLRSRDEDSVDE